MRRDKMQRRAVIHEYNDIKISIKSFEILNLLVINEG